MGHKGHTVQGGVFFWTVKNRGNLTITERVRERERVFQLQKGTGQYMI